MQIRTLFLACMLAVTALATCLGTWMLLQKVGEYHLAGRVERAVEIDAKLFEASDKIGLERPVVGDALLGDAPAGVALRARLASVREDADRSLDDVEKLVADASYPGAAAQLTIVRKTKADLAAWRANVDTALSHPRRERDPDIFEHYIADLNTVFDTTSVALDVGDLAASQHDGTSVELISLARHVWAVRATMGVRTVPLMAAIDAGSKLSSEVLEEQRRFDGLMSANWTPITALSRRLSRLDGLASTIAAGRAAADAYDQLCQAVIAAGRAGPPYPISALDLGRQVVRTAPVLLRIRDEALAAARARVSESRQEALWHVVIAGAALTLTVAAMAGTLIILQRRIVSPLLALIEVIGRLASLDFDVEIPARKRMDEIGRMAVALDSLRQGAMAGEENKARIAHLARHDALTGLPNRLAMQESLEQVVAMSGRGVISAVLCIDLDRFKAVNDTFGHPAGDLLLRSVAERLMACVREVDTVSRFGGDEFVVLLAGVEQPEQAAVVAQRIVRLLSEPFDLDGHKASIGCSVGIAVTPRDATGAVALLKCADTALYRAKLEGKGVWRFFQPEMNAHLQERMELECDLRDALGNGDLELAYQPQYRLDPSGASGDRLCGFEALVRWNHPTRGMIAPAAFIPIAEETGLIVTIGEWVLRQACQEATSWPDTVRLAVNLSGVQFGKPGLVAAVRRALSESGLPAARLELEITESVLLTNTSGNLAILHELRDMGIHIAMDDFGTGYSSLSYLRSFPFDTIKIDRSFVRDLPEDPAARAIIRSVVALARGLGMATTAEGVETRDQLEELRRGGCTDVQGFLLSQPVRARAALELINSGQVASQAA